MSWWTNSQTIIKSKSRFIVKFVESGLLITAKTCSKPTANIESKEFRLTNHFFNYPGLVKWDPIEITFVDGDGGDKKFKQLATADDFNSLLKGSGYSAPLTSGNYRDTPSKEKLSGNIGKIIIQQLAPVDVAEKKAPRITEEWTLHNPIVTKMSWGSLDYGADDAVEYSLSIKYDYATLK